MPRVDGGAGIKARVPGVDQGIVVADLRKSTQGQREPGLGDTDDLHCLSSSTWQ